MKRLIGFLLLFAAQASTLADTAKEIEASNQRRYEFCMERKLGVDWWKFATARYVKGEPVPTPEQVKKRKIFDAAHKACRH